MIKKFKPNNNFTEKMDRKVAVLTTFESKRSTKVCLIPSKENIDYS
jgi:hypothetical protein